MTTNAYRSKKALFDYLITLAAPAGPLENLQIAYAWPGSNVEPECVYGGGVRFEQRDAVAEAPGILVAEEALVTVYIRVVARPPLPVEETDARAADIGDALASALRSQPKLAGEGTILGIARGQGDYHRTDDETVTVLTYQVRMTSNLSYGVF